MKISIYQKRLSINDHFRIFLNGEKLYTGKRGIFSFRIKVFNEKGELVSLIKRKSLTEIDASYKIDLIGKTLYNFETVSWRKGIWAIRSDDDEFVLYGHEGFHYSIYKGDLQVGKASKNDFVLFGGDKFEIESNNDEDELLLISIFLAIDNALFISRGIRIGYPMKLSKDGKRRNWNWKPKEG